MILEALSVGPMAVNCYIVAQKEGRQAVIIDPGSEGDKINNLLAKYKLSAGMVINTHGHYDHIGADDMFSVKVYVHRLDAPLLKDPMLNLSGLFSSPYKVRSGIELLEDMQKLELDGIELEVLHTPGHTRGGIALLLQKPQGKIVFTGDTLFCQGIGRTDLPGGDEEALLNSIKERLFTLPSETKIYPGHGPFSTIGEEKRSLLI